MDIAKKLYVELKPKPRAIALYAAINRADQAEVNRLVDQAPRRAGHGRVILELGQAMDLYNRLVSRSIRDFLLVAGKVMEADSFCEGWLSAGGSVENEEYREKCKNAEALLLICENRAIELETACQAAREWCEKNEVPVDFFSGPLCFHPLRKSIDYLPIDDEILAMMRSGFDAIQLT